MMDRHRDRETTDRQTNRWTNRQTDDRQIRNRKNYKDKGRYLQVPRSLPLSSQEKLSTGPTPVNSTVALPTVSAMTTPLLMR